MLAIRCESEIKIADAFCIKDSIKEIAGRRFDAVTRAWYVPLTDGNVALLKILGVDFDESAEMPKDAGEPIPDEPPIVDMPIKATPYKHQVAAFNFALRILGGAE